MFQTALVYTSVFLDYPNKVAISKDTRLSIYLYGDPSVCICVNIYVCIYLYMYVYVFMYIYECPRKKNLQAQKARGTLEPER